MLKLEDITYGSIIQGLLPNQRVTIIEVKWWSSEAVEVTYKDNNDQLYKELLGRDKEAYLEIVTGDCPWSFKGDAARFRLVSEAYRIRLAHLFDPLLAVHTSQIEPLPHQITAVYGQMLNRQPLRFLLADDPGAGKTIMAGLLIRELLIRGDLQRCLIVCPGNLAIQWQDELHQKFYLPFDILTNDRIETARTGNVFTEIDLVIARLDKLSRDEKVQEKLKQTDWDLIICDEAHKMSASFFGKKVKETKRYKLGKLLSSITRHFLLMTATPHNGKEEDFQLFLALLDGDRFEGKFRDGVHVCDTSDLMRRLVKEELLKFDGKPLFPERIAHTVTYPLSTQEGILYDKVTDYVREEFNRSEKLHNDRRKGTVGFALTILQRRLASSPEAIYQSLKRRRERLEKRLQEEKLSKKSEKIEIEWNLLLETEDIDNDCEDFDSQERENALEEIVDQATAARTILELQNEINLLKQLEHLAYNVRCSNKDCKWEQFSSLLQDEAEMFDIGGYRRKLVVFTEHRDTLNYLQERISNILGNREAVVTIHGSMGREERKQAEESFKQDVEIQVLLATDAAGEGINLQRAHLMVNYDLPWNPNRLEQRFGRIHRIGQKEVCHLWNLVADQTREGDVYRTLLLKLEAEQRALGGRVFDVLGKAIASKELRELLIEAIRYGDRPEVKARLNQVVSSKLDQNRIKELLQERALARDCVDISQVQQIRENMERVEVRRLQPYFIGSFFLEAFQQLGGKVRQREAKRYEITHVPSVIRNGNRQQPILISYERICFANELISVSGKPLATFICPGHPLLDATIDIILEKYQHLLRQGTIFVDDHDLGEEMRILVYLQHSIQDARLNKDGRRRILSRQMQYVEINSKGDVGCAGYAPYLNYRPLAQDEAHLVESILDSLDIAKDIENKAISYAIAHLLFPHLEGIKQRQEQIIEKTIAAVKDRLLKEIYYWDEQANKSRAQDASKAQARANELHNRLQKRLSELEQERQISPLTPMVIGAALVIPLGLIQKLAEIPRSEANIFAQETQSVEEIAMTMVMAAETALGYQPRDVSGQKCGYDIESSDPTTGSLRFIEVKGRITGADTVTVTKNEILTALNKPENFFLVLVSIPEGDHSITYDQQDCQICYVQEPFSNEPDFAVHSVNYNWQHLWQKGEKLFLSDLKINNTLLT